MNSQNLRSFRLVCPAEHINLVENLLYSQGFKFYPEPFSPWVRRLEYEPFPLGASLAARFGYIYIQDRSSMLPPLVLNPDEGSSVIDMCASPGSKTGFLGQLVGKNGFVLGNEPSKTRLATLRHNLCSLNLLQCATISFAGEDIPLGETASTGTKTKGWDFILLDPPCSGWGTVEKNPQVLNLWQGEKVKPLINLQRLLLAKAFTMLNSGGRMVYSTCTTNRAENENQLLYACEELGFKFIPVSPPAGFDFAEVEDKNFAGALRVPTSADSQGFFVALLEKPQQTSTPEAAHCLQKSEHTNVIPEPLKATNPRNNAPHNQLEYLDTASIDSELVCANNLPQGSLGVFNGNIHFLPKASGQLIPQGLPWKGFPIGKLHSGRIKINHGLHTLMPATYNEQAAINMETPEPILALISGQSIVTDSNRSELGLYFQGLPLCRLQVKGKRVMFPQML